MGGEGVPCRNFAPPLSTPEIDRILNNFQPLIKSLIDVEEFVIEIHFK
jgi:hypothetical protein